VTKQWFLARPTISILEPSDRIAEASALGRAGLDRGVRVTPLPVAECALAVQVREAAFVLPAIEDASIGNRLSDATSWVREGVITEL